MENTKTPTGSAPRSKDKFKVLFVDDDTDFLLLMRRRLKKLSEEQNLQLLFANDGVEALDMIERDPAIYLVFSDVFMPEMNGLELTGKLREMKDRVIHTVIVSGFGDMKNIRQAMNFGAFDFIAKPFEIEDFKATLLKAKGEIESALEGIRAKEALQVALMEKDRAEQMDQIRQQFFANITHEFRTPLTLMLGPLDQVARSTAEHKTRKNVSMALRNSKVLLRLINQLLDLGKLDSGQMQLHPRRVELRGFVTGITETFNDLAERKSIQLSHPEQIGKLDMDCDPDKVELILNNLLSNALKFTPQNGSIDVKVGYADPEKENIMLSVKDTGHGISEERLPFIFDRYFQVDSERAGARKGTGIGLALTKELVELHKGNIKVKSIEGLGTEFIVTFPLNHEGSQKARKAKDSEPGLASSLEQETIEVLNMADEDPVLEEDQSNVVLVIDDNPDIRDYIRGALEPKYTVIEAIDGDMGLEKAEKFIPDMIISDVMMPGKDGFEVCRILKTEEKTSHIPVILLTARSSTESKIEGLDQQADDYVTKPFNTPELLSRIKNLIEVRRNLKERFRMEFLSAPGKVKAQSMEEEFLLKLRALVDQHLDNEEFSVEEMAELMGMSRTQLHRKLKAITDSSASEFVRNYRLDIAMQLLKQNSGPVGEIAFQVGFSSPSYFTRCFSSRFNMSPKEVRK